MDPVERAEFRSRFTLGISTAYSNYVIVNVTHNSECNIQVEILCMIKVAAVLYRYIICSCNYFNMTCNIINIYFLFDFVR